MPSLVVEERNHTAYANPESPYERTEVQSRPNAFERAFAKETKDRLVNGEIGRANGWLMNGTANLQSLPNGYVMDRVSNHDEASTRSEGPESSMNGRASSLENRLGRLDLDGIDGERSRRDDGHFAQNGETTKHFWTTQVKLDASAINSIDGSGESKIPPSREPPPVPVSETTSPVNKDQVPLEAAYNTIDGTLQIQSSSVHRLSSPPAFSHPGSSSSAAPSTTSSIPHPPGARLQHRHTLEVPKVSTSRGSRDFPSVNTSDDVVSATGRFSPSTPTRRRASVTLVRRTTRSIHSDMHLDEVPQDEDAARWAEHIRQKRASKRKREEDKDDDRVVVGTKVDQNHVNWVTAYNMLTGIRFTVSRTNAKMDRELTEADFEARHKFSFDM